MTKTIKFCPSCLSFTPGRKELPHYKGKFDFVSIQCKTCFDNNTSIDPARMEAFFGKPAISHDDLLEKFEGSNDKDEVYRRKR